MKLYVLNSKPFDPNGYIFQALVRALSRRLDVQLYVINSDQLMQIPIDPFNQSLLVYGGEELHQISPELILRPFGRRAIWFTEDPYELKRNQDSAKYFHVVFTNDSGSLDSYRHASHLPLAADLDYIPIPLSRGLKRLLFFSGTAWPNRKELLYELLDQWPNAEDFDLHLVANPFVERQVVKHRLHQNLRFEESIAISDFVLRSANSLCTLVVGRDFSGSGRHIYARSPGPRLFEAGLTGSCQLVHSSEIPDMPVGLEEGRHYLRFSSTVELVDLLREANVNPDSFRAIGSAMAAEIQTNHTYDQRASEIVESLLNCKPESQAFSLRTSQLRALFISHEQTKPGYNHGGAGLCLDQIVAEAPHDVDLRILCPSGDDGHSFVVFNRYGETVGGFRCKQKVNEFSLHHPELDEHIERLLNEWKPHLVHVNHLLGFTPSVLPLARKAGAYTSLTLHDYYAICDSWNLLDTQHKFCGINQFFDNRCQSCCATRRPQFSFVDPLRRRIVISEALAYAQVVIVPSRAAERQLRSVLPHLPPTEVIEPVVDQTINQLKSGDGPLLIVLIAGNLAINKGYLELQQIIEQCNVIGLSIQFRVLGRVESWIEQELALYTNVVLLGTYDNSSFASKAAGADLALFISPWPETYCITFDEWKNSGRPCFYYRIGALTEPQRQQGLHPASEAFDVDDRDGLMHALIQATTPHGLRKLRAPNKVIQSSITNISFGLKHWSLFADALNTQKESSPIYWQKHPLHQQWVDYHENSPLPTIRQKLVSLIYRLPYGHKLASLLRWMLRR